MTVAPGEFIRRFMLHILPKGFHRIRHYGLLARSRTKADTLAWARELIEPATRVQKPRPQTNQDHAPAGTEAIDQSGARLRGRGDGWSGTDWSLRRQVHAFEQDAPALRTRRRDRDGLIGLCQVSAVGAHPRAAAQPLSPSYHPVGETHAVGDLFLAHAQDLAPYTYLGNRSWPIIGGSVAQLSPIRGWTHPLHSFCFL